MTVEDALAWANEDWEYINTDAKYLKILANEVILLREQLDNIRECWNCPHIKKPENE